MFALRGIAVSFSVFLIVYCAASLAVLCTWNRVYQGVHDHPMHRLGNLFFGLRMFPIVLATLITAGFAVPSFLLLEPRSIVEPVGNVPLTLALLGSGLAALGLGNAVLAVLKASRTVSNWSNAAEEIASTIPFPVLRIRRSVPALTTAGILRPKILLSGSAEFLLNGNELRTALHHEIAHIRRRDNFKKFLLCFVAFPGMRGLDTAWLEASEMAADDAAVSSTADALDLAAALLKLSRVKADEPSPDLSAALVHGHAAIINARVERLISWPERPETSGDFSARSILGVVLPILALFAITYGSVLADVHRATEWLIR